MARVGASGAIRRHLDLTKGSCAVDGSTCGTKRTAIGCAPCKRAFRRAVRTSSHGYDDARESRHTCAAQGAFAGCEVSGPSTRLAVAGVPEQLGDGQRESSQGVPGECGERGLVRMLYSTLIRYEISDWTVAIALGPASRENLVWIVLLPARRLGTWVNRERDVIRSFRSDRSERSGAVDRHGRF